MAGVRLDKWLWAARFFKTRSKAKEAIEGGKVHVAGSRAKPSRDVVVGEELVVRQGFDERAVIVLAVSDQRRGASEAQALYQERAESIERREREASQRKLAGGAMISEGKPSKRDRRRINDFREKNQN